VALQPPTVSTTIGLLEAIVNDLQQQLDAAWRVRQAHFAPEIRFAYPLDTALISLTGDRCALQCAHCGGHYLCHMQPVWSAAPGGATSALISGGCDRQGRVPVTGYLEQIAAIKQGRRLNWHVGLIDEGSMRAIAPYVDVISFDVVGDAETIREVYGLQATPEDYAETYAMLRHYVPVIPHITVGLHGGQLGHERPAMDLLARIGLEALVFIVLIPTPGTRYAERTPPAAEEVALLLAEARQRFPRASLQLGCMRPRRSYRAQLDPLAVQAGANVIVSPAREAIAEAVARGLQVVETRECCVL
jgi:lipoyl synthase